MPANLAVRGSRLRLAADLRTASRALFGRVWVARLAGIPGPICIARSGPLLPAVRTTTRPGSSRPLCGGSKFLAAVIGRSLLVSGPPRSAEVEARRMRTVLPEEESERNPPSELVPHDSANRARGISGSRSRYSGQTTGGGESGIRTHGTVLPYTRFPSVRLKPLGHLSGMPLLPARAAFFKGAMPTLGADASPDAVPGNAGIHPSSEWVSLTSGSAGQARR
jgi:hypothetical protein